MRPILQAGRAVQGQEVCRRTTDGAGRPVTMGSGQQVTALKHKGKFSCIKNDLD